MARNSGELTAVSACKNIGKAGMLVREIAGTMTIGGYAVGSKPDEANKNVTESQGCVIIWQFRLKPPQTCHGARANAS